MTYTMHYILVLCLGAYVLGSPVSPYDLLDETQALLEDLRSYVTAEIVVAHSNLDDVSDSSMSFGASAYLRSYMTLTGYASSRAKRVNMAKMEAENSGQDKSYCFEDEGQLTVMYNTAIEKLRACVVDVDGQVTSLIGDAKYVADIQYNKVTEIQFYLSKCTIDDVTCITSVVTMINENNLQLVQNIHTEVQRASDTADILKLVYPTCQEVALETYTVDSNELIDDMYVCVRA